MHNTFIIRWHKNCYIKESRWPRPCWIVHKAIVLHNGKTTLTQNQIANITSRHLYAWSNLCKIERHNNTSDDDVICCETFQGLFLCATTSNAMQHVWPIQAIDW